jgi:hypothetical protein
MKNSAIYLKMVIFYLVGAALIYLALYKLV